MSCQTSLDSYYTNRKRHATDETIAKKAKVLILDGNYDASPNSVSGSLEQSEDVPVKQLIVKQGEVKSERKKVLVRTPHHPKKTPKTTSGNKIKKKKEIVGQGDIRKALFPTLDKSGDNGSRKAPEVKEEPLSYSSSPLPAVNEEGVQNLKEEDSMTDKPEPPKKEKQSSFEKLKTDLGLGSIKAKLIRSPRIAELKSALENLKKSHEKLEEMQNKSPLKSPALHEFKKIEVEVPLSPSKAKLELANSPSRLREAVFRSPVKSTNLPYESPRKLLDEVPKLFSPTKSPAFNRYSSFASSERQGLILPYKYRILAEIFRSVDLIVSIMFNRQESITFSKLKQSVQSHNKKALYESHLGQIASVLPDAFSFKQEKVRQMGSQDKYELVLYPNIQCEEQNSKDFFTPSITLKRKREFYNSLMERTKDHHEEFLKSLDPPMTVPRDKLTRWHPEFDVDACPDIQVTELPQPPNEEKCSTARDVLNKAREMFSVNHRMEKALQNLSENAGIQPPIPSPASQAIPALTNALKGIPKSILEKVRAKQAAKAFELLTRDPAQTKLGTELKRLPEIARILRNLFVGEKKNVIEYSFVIQKLVSSYREILSYMEMDHHINLIVERVPKWLSLYNVRGGRYLKMAKDMEMSEILATLQNCANKFNS